MNNSISFLSSVILSFSVSPVDQSGSVGSGQPLVNAMKTDSALIGGTVLPLNISATGEILEGKKKKKKM